MYSTGAWSCLDEFNRMSDEVLSVVGQQLFSMHKGKLIKVVQIYCSLMAKNITENLFMLYLWINYCILVDLL